MDLLSDWRETLLVPRSVTLHTNPNLLQVCKMIVMTTHSHTSRREEEVFSQLDKETGTDSAEFLKLG